MARWIPSTSTNALRKREEMLRDMKSLHNTLRRKKTGFDKHLEPVIEWLQDPTDPAQEAWDELGILYSKLIGPYFKTIGIDKGVVENMYKIRDYLSDYA